MTDALVELRLIAHEFVRGRKAFETFYPRLLSLIGAMEGWDPPESQRAELELYRKWAGGPDGAFLRVLPRREADGPSYCEEEFSWVDRERFFELFAADLEAVGLT